MALSTVEDETALRALIARYSLAVDDRDAAAVSECFTTDALLEANGGCDVATGREGIRSYFLEAFARPALSPGSASTHLLTPVIMSVDSERAHVETLGVAIIAAPSAPEVRIRGLRYSDQCSRTEDGWLISSRKHRATWQCGAPGGVL